MSLPRLLITGSGGLIGMILWNGLVDEFEIFGLDRTASSKRKTFTADIAEYSQVADVLRELAPLSYLIHLAAAASPSAGWDVVLRDNIAGTRNIYEAARQAGVRRIVFASSTHVTGAYEGSPPNRFLHTQPEPEQNTVRHPIRPDSDYAVSKACGEAMARYNCARFGIESICLRIGSVLADDDPSHDPRSRKIWLSHRDLLQLVRKCLFSNVTFGVYYGVSNNKGRFWDILNARLEIGYQPEDDASTR